MNVGVLGSIFDFSISALLDAYYMMRVVSSGRHCLGFEAINIPTYKV